MELDQALEFAVILGWKDLSKISSPSLVRVEYEFAPAAGLEHLSVWLIKAGGYQDLVYEHWTKASWGYPAGARFANGHNSAPLDQALQFIVKNQDQFARSVERRSSRILVHPPTTNEHAEARLWLQGTANVVAAASVAECAA